jgi:hypothetical protein
MKRKKGGPEDFRKIKTKVGKQATHSYQNVTTNLAVRSKSESSFTITNIVNIIPIFYLLYLEIVLSDQGLTSERNEEAVNYRNLTLRDLCVQMKHYNANVRKGKR